MKVNLVTAPTVEPVTLSELKLHLRYDGGTFADNIDSTQSIAPGSHAIANDYVTHVGASKEVLGYSAIVLLESGTNAATGTADVKVQESDDNAAWTDWATGAFTQVTTANDNATYEKAYTGSKRYIRTVAKVLLAACEFGTSIVRNAATSVEDDLLNAIITASREHVEDITRRAIMTQTWDYFLDEFPDDDAIVLPFGNLASVTSVKYKEDDGTETNLTKTLTAFADSSTSPGTKTTVTSAAHGYSDADLVFIDGTTSYDGAWTISNVTTNTFDITTAYVADDATGTATTYYIVETNGESHGRIVLPYGETWPSVSFYPSNPISIRFVCGWASAALVPYRIKSAIKLLCADMYRDRGDAVIGQTVVESKTVDRLLASCRLWGNFE